MDKKLLMNVIEPEESRVAVLEEGILEEFYVERGRSGHYAGNIYKGIVRKVEPSLQAAFVDFGAQRNGFLHLSEVVPEMGRRRRIFGSAPGDQRRPIQELLRPNQEFPQTHRRRATTDERNRRGPQGAQRYGNYSAHRGTGPP